MRAGAWLMLLAACTSTPGGEELKLGRRSRDAGPAVIIVDRPGRTGGPAIEEHEPNDPPGGQALPVPGSVRGRIDRAGDVDVYRIQVPTAGTLRVSLSGVDDADLVLEVQQPGGELVAASDNGPAKVAEGFPNLFVQPGELRLVVREYVKPPRRRRRRAKPVVRESPSQPYLLQVSLWPPPGPGEEREPNDESAFADEIALGQVGRGYLGWRRDRDFWRVPLAGVRDDEALSIDVDGVAGVALDVEVQDGTGASLLERKGRPGAPLALRSIAVRDENPIYFVVVSGSRQNDAEPYTIRVAPVPLVVDEETEPNDTPATASPLSDVPGATSGKRVGTLAPGDVDVFHLEPADGGRRLSVSVTPPPGADVALAVVSAGGAPLAPPADAAKKGGEEKLTAVPIAAKADAYIEVIAKDAGGDTDRYRLVWSLAAQ